MKLLPSSSQKMEFLEMDLLKKGMSLMSSSQQKQFWTLLEIKNW